jgi:Cys-rich protein (TIGR01571 family)
VPPGEKREEAGVVTHHELRITHEHAAPTLPNPNNQQPSATQGMVVGSRGGGNRNVRNLPVIAGRGRPWSDGLCSFSDLCGTFCLACWCPCIAYGQNKARLDYLSNHGASDPRHGGGGSCSGDCFLHGCLTSFCGIGWVLQISTRKNTRSRYNIAGGGLEDCCTSLCCGPCALTQESKEMGLEESSLVVRR